MYGNKRLSRIEGKTHFKTRQVPRYKSSLGWNKEDIGLNKIQRDIRKE